MEVFGREHEKFLRNYLELPNGNCLGPKLVEEKANEIKAIPELLDCLNIKGTIITTDAMGTQTAIVKKIRQKGRIMYWH